MASELVVVVCVRLDERTLKVIDRKRKRASRSDWLREQIGGLVGVEPRQPRRRQSA